MSVPEESKPKTTDTDQVVNADRGDDAREPDTREEMEAKLQDAMEEENLTREDFGGSSEEE